MRTSIPMFRTTAAQNVDVNDNVRIGERQVQVIGVSRNGRYVSIYLADSTRLYMHVMDAVKVKRAR